MARTTAVTGSPVTESPTSAQARTTFYWDVGHGK